MDGADLQERSRVYPGSGGDHRAMASEWSAPGPPILYRELALLTKFMILGEIPYLGFQVTLPQEV